MEVTADSVLLTREAVDDPIEALAANVHAHNSVDRAAFLPGYDPHILGAYAEWLERKRAEISATVRRVFVTELVSQRKAGNWARVESIARELLRLDSFNEEATLALAEATALIGSKTEALELLDRYSLDTGRSDIALPARIVRRRITEQILLDPSPTPRSAPFTGRAKELAALWSAYQESQNSRRAALVTGPAGIGKTRLLNEALRQLSLDGYRSITVRCTPAHENRVAGVLLELVPQLRCLPGALGIEPHLLRHLDVLVQHRDGQANSAVDSNDVSTRASLLSIALTDLIEAVSTEQRLIILIEDIQWADAHSLRELAQIATLADGARFFLLLSARYLRPDMRELLRDDRFTTINVAPLDTGDLHSLATHLLGGFVRPEVLQWCISNAAGNPLYLMMLCEHASRTGDLAVPSSLRELITRRIEQLDSRSRRVLEVCALLRRHATMDALLTTTQMVSIDLVTAIRRLEEEAYLEWRDGQLQVTHDLLGQTALATVPGLTLRFLHHIVAQHLEKQYDEHLDASVMWDCTEHWSASGDRAKALHFAKRCAAHAVDIGRADYACDLLSRATRLTGDPGALRELLTLRLLAAKAAREWGTAYATSLELARLNPGFATQHCVSETISLEALWEQRYAADDVAPQLLRCATSTADPEHRLDAAVLLLRVAHECTRRELGHQAFHAVRDALVAAPDCYSRWMTPLIYHTTFGDIDEALRIARGIRAELSRRSSITLRFRLAMNVALAFSFLGASDEAIFMFSEIHSDAQRLKLLDWEVEAAAGACSVALDREDYSSAREWYTRCANLGGRPGISPRASRVLMGAMAELALRLGTEEQMRRAYEELAKIDFGSSLRSRSYVKLYPIRMQLRDPRFQCDEACIDELKRHFMTTRDFTGVDNFASALIDALMRRGAYKDAAETLKEYVAAHRRERSELPPSLARQRTILQRELTNGNSI
ncbi:MAG TPA: AAA family ATPase [Gemmatimonadaceae bacterium]|nr:AAA family ATPase [Gemmatimonadaceae bacterium]